MHACVRNCAGGAERKVISADRHVVRVWDASSGAALTSIQPEKPGINDVLHWPGSGLLMLGMDAPKIEVGPRHPAHPCWTSCVASHMHERTPSARSRHACFAWGILVASIPRILLPGAGLQDRIALACMPCVAVQRAGSRVRASDRLLALDWESAAWQGGC